MTLTPKRKILCKFTNFKTYSKKAMSLVKLVIILTTLATTQDALQNNDLIKIDYRTSAAFNNCIEGLENHEDGTDDSEDEIDSKVSQTRVSQCKEFTGKGFNQRKDYSEIIQGDHDDNLDDLSDDKGRVEYIERRRLLQNPNTCSEVSKSATELVGLRVKVDERNIDVCDTCDINSYLDSTFLVNLTDVFDLQKMASEDISSKIAQAEAATAGCDDQNGVNLSTKAMMQFYQFVEITKKETVANLNQTITGVEIKLTKKMEKDKQDLTNEIERKNQENRRVINADVKKQMAELEQRRQEERHEDDEKWQKLEEREKKRQEELEEDRRKLAELSDMVNNVHNTSQNNIVQQQIMREKISTGLDVLAQNSQNNTPPGSEASQSTLSSARVVVPLDDPRRAEFSRMVNECRRTVVIHVGGIDVFNGTDCAGNELAYYLGKFNNEVMQGLYGITGKRALFYLDQIEDSPGAFRWRRPDMDRSTNRPKMEGNRESPHKFYVRFKNTKSKYDFEDEKRHLHSEAEVTVIGFFPKCFKEKHDALTTEGKKWKEIQLKNKSWAQYKICYDNIEDEMYLDVRNRRGGVWSRVTTDLPSLLRMSLVHFKDTSADGYRKLTEDEINKRKEEHRNLNEIRKTLPRVEKSDSVKRSFSRLDVTDAMLEKFTKKPKGMSQSFLAAITKGMVKHKLPNLDLGNLVDKEGTSVRVRHYTTNRDRVIRKLETNNKTSTYTHKSSDPLIVNGKKLYKCVTVQVPTSLFLVSARRFLLWTDNKVLDIGKADFITITKVQYTTDREDVPSELRIHFENSRDHSNTACVHIYFTKSKIQVQGGSMYGNNTFAFWLWENVIKTALEETKIAEGASIHVTSKKLAETVIAEKEDKRIKGSHRKSKNSKVSPKSGANRFVYNFGNNAGQRLSKPRTDVTGVRVKPNLNTEKGSDVGTDDVDRAVSNRDEDVGDIVNPLSGGKSENLGAVPKVPDLMTYKLAPKKKMENEGKATEGMEDDGKVDEEIARIIEEDESDFDEDIRGEREKTPRENNEEPEEIDLTEDVIQTPADAGLRRRLHYNSAEDIQNISTNIMENREKGYVSDDYTGVTKTVILEIPSDLIWRFRYIYETFTGGMAEIQVHLTGTRSEENNATIVRVNEMVIPQQSGTIHECHIVDPNFLKNLKKRPEAHVGLLHVHPAGGCYLSGEDNHTTAYFEKSTGGPFVSGVFDPVNNEYAFMRIKDTKLEHVSKCQQLSRIYETPEHSHPDSWAFISVREIETPVIICDLREGSSNKDSNIDKSKIFGPVDSVPLIRNLNGDPWTPLSKEAFLAYHKEMKDAGIMSIRKPYLDGANAADPEDKPKVKLPGDKHWDEKFLELSMPIEDFSKPEKGHETVKGLLVQKRKDFPVIKRTGMKKTTSEPDLEKLLQEMEKLNALCADLSQANVGLQSELTRMKESATIFGSTSFERVDDHSLIARVLSAFGKAMTSGMTMQCKNCNWFGKLMTDLDENKGKIKDILQWLKDNVKGNLDDEKNANVQSEGENFINATCKSLRENSNADLQILSWNMNGHHKVQELEMIIDEVNPSVILLQETKLNASSVLKFQMLFSDRFYFYSKTSEDNVDIDDINLETLEGSGGVSIMWKKELNSKVMKIDVNFASSVAVIINTGLKRVLLLSIYAPCFGKNQEFSDHLDNLSALFNKEEKNYDEILAVGDWNVSNKSSEARKEEMEIWCLSRELSRFDPPMETHKHFVWQHLSYLDCAISNSSDITVTNAELTFDTTSDHQPITVTLKMGSEVRNDGGASMRLQTAKYEGNLWKLDRNKIDDLNAEVARQFAWSESLEKLSTDARLIGINKSLVRAHNKIMPRRMVGPRNQKGLYGLRKERRILQLLKEKRGDDAFTAGLNLQLNDIRRKRRKGEQSRIFKKFKENPNDVFKFISKLKGRGPGTPDKLVEGEEIFYDDAAFEKIIHHYDILGKHTNPLYNEDADMNEEWINTVTRIVNLIMNSKDVKDDKLEPMTLSELKSVVNSFPANKASDLDGVSHDMLKHLDDSNLTFIMTWINDLFEKDDYTSPELSKSRFSLLYKSGPNTSLGNYRRLTVSSIMLRIIERTLLRRGMSQKMEDSLEDQQFGFRRNRSYTFPLLEITELMRKHKQESTPLFILSTDVAKAFPRMDPRINLFEMYKRGFSGGELKFSRDTYLCRTSRLKVGENIVMSPVVFDNYGETEGGCTCPGRASMNFDIITKAVNGSTFGVEQNGIIVVNNYEENDSEEEEEDVCELIEVKRKVPSRLQADDAIYALRSIYEAAACWKAIYRESKFSRCHYNEKKCAVLGIAVDHDVIDKQWTRIREEQGIEIPLVKEVKYLGLVLSNEKDQDVKNVLSKIGGSNGNLRVISGAGLNNQQLCEPRLRISMIYSYAVSKCLAGLDSQRLSNTGEEKLRVYGQELMRKAFFLHKAASTHVAHLLTGKVGLHIYWRISQINLMCRVFALNTQLAETLRWDFIHETKHSWMYQVTTSLIHYGIRGFDKLILGDGLNTKNCRDVFLSIKEIILEREFETIKRRLMMQRWVNHLDLSSVKPSKPSRIILGAKSIQEIRGISVQVQFLSAAYLTSSVTSAKSTCVVCKKTTSRDCPSHIFLCSKATIVRSLKLQLLQQLPVGHPASYLPLDSKQLILFVLDCESELLHQYQLVERPPNFDRIQTLCRLICYFAHNNRARVIKKMKKSELNLWRGVQRSPKRKQNKVSKSFLDL